MFDDDIWYNHVDTEVASMKEDEIDWEQLDTDLAEYEKNQKGIK